MLRSNQIAEIPKIPHGFFLSLVDSRKYVNDRAQRPVITIKFKRAISSSRRVAGMRAILYRVDHARMYNVDRSQRPWRARNVRSAESPRSFADSLSE